MSLLERLTTAFDSVGETLSSSLERARESFSASELKKLSRLTEEDERDVKAWGKHIDDTLEDISKEVDGYKSLVDHFKNVTVGSLERIDRAINFLDTEFNPTNTSYLLKAIFPSKKFQALIEIIESLIFFQNALDKKITARKKNWLSSILREGKNNSLLSVSEHTELINSFHDLHLKFNIKENELQSIHESYTNAGGFISELVPLKEMSKEEEARIKYFASLKDHLDMAYSAIIQKAGGLRKSFGTSVDGQLSTFVSLHALATEAKVPMEKFFSATLDAEDSSNVFGQSIVEGAKLFKELRKLGNTGKRVEEMSKSLEAVDKEMAIVSLVRSLTRKDTINSSFLKVVKSDLEERLAKLAGGDAKETYIKAVLNRGLDLIKAVEGGRDLQIRESEMLSGMLSDRVLGYSKLLDILQTYTTDSARVQQAQDAGIDFSLIVRYSKKGGLKELHSFFKNLLKKDKSKNSDESKKDKKEDPQKKYKEFLRSTSERMSSNTESVLSKFEKYFNSMQLNLFSSSMDSMKTTLESLLGFLEPPLKSPPPERKFKINTLSTVGEYYHKKVLDVEKLLKIPTKGNPLLDSVKGKKVSHIGEPATPYNLGLLPEPLEKININKDSFQNDTQSGSILFLDDYKPTSPLIELTKEEEEAYKKAFNGVKVSTKKVTKVIVDNSLAIQNKSKENAVRKKNGEVINGTRGLNR